MVEGVDAWAEASVQAKDLTNGQSSQRKVVEQVDEILSDVGVSVFSETLVVESRHLSDLAGLVIATQYRDAFAVADLKGHENCDGLDGVIASIDVVAHEEVISVRRFSTDPIKII